MVGAIAEVYKLGLSTRKIERAAAYVHTMPRISCPRIPSAAPYRRVIMLQTHLYCILSDGAQMPDSYTELIKGNPGETEIRSFLVDGDQVSVTLRIPDTLRDAAKEEAALRGMSFSAFVRTCMIDELAKKGA